MGFKFTFLCDLLSSLEDNQIAKVTAANKDTPDIRTVAQWFSRHDRHIHHPDTDKLALLSCLFPEKRPDRVYWLQATSLARLIGRCLGLGSSRLSDLDQWRAPGGPDLGQCVENVMRQAENQVRPGQEVSVEEIDQALNMIASRCRFSGPRVRRQQAAVDVEGAISPLYRRMSSRDARWFTRMILKSYSPVTVPEKYTLQRFHFLLPHLLQFQNTFEGALEMLSSEPINHFPPQPDPKLAANLCSIAVDYLRPRTGSKIGTPEYLKARSIKHCYQMAKGRRMAIERKYDGEYCQIHVDLTNKQFPIQIFSKSGKDSTANRSAIIPVLKETLRLNTPRCKFHKYCILEGELLVWSDQTNGIAAFHKLRTFLPRAGTFIGVDHDSPPQPYEHLMIVFFDVLLLDDNVCLKAPHRQRRLLLQDVIQKLPGHADIAEQEILDFNEVDSQRRLEVSFAQAIAQRWEGLVLKASDEPYFPIHAAGLDNSFGRWIKLKKDYIPGLGDTVDLALVGAYYNAQDGATLASLGTLQWTHFLVGCLMNKDAVAKCEVRAQYRIIDVVNRHSMHWKVLQLLNQLGEFQASDPADFEAFDIQYGRADLLAASVIFKKPFVVEMMGSGFEKPSGGRYFTLRFPRILKVHTERTPEDAASYKELQLLAENARSIPADELSQEEEQWRKRLKVGNGLKDYIVRKSRSLSSQKDSSTESDMPGASDTTVDDYEEGPQPLPMHSSAEKRLSFTANQDCSPSSLQNKSVVYVDESRLSPGPNGLQHDTNVLVENQNLSNRRASKQPVGDTSAQVDQRASKPVAESWQGPTFTTDLPGDQVANQDSGKGILHSRKMEQSVSGEPTFNSSIDSALPDDFSSESTSSEQGTPPTSPLMTIPVYMSGIPAENDTPSGEHSSSLSQFMQALGSDETRSLFSRSNPLASREGAIFGIALVNSGELPLGQVVQKVAKALSQSSQSPDSKLPAKGKIFFLDAAIMTENIESESPKFCLRQTWCTLGIKYYFACLCWNFDNGRDPARTGPEFVQQHGNSRSQRGTSSPPLFVSFDEHEILALGEYTIDDRLTDSTSDDV